MTPLKLHSSLPIDVIVPVFNGQEYIEEALASIAAQSRRPHQIIVIDDGSTDDTAKVVKKFTSKIPIVYVFKKNGGLSSARNAGILKSSSDVLAFLDADDRWEPSKLAKQWHVFEQSILPKIGVVYCDYYLMDSQSTRLRIDRFRLNPACRGNIYSALLETNVVASSGSGVLVKRECFERAGLFDETFSNCEDWDMWLRIAHYFEYDYVPEELVGIRRHNGNMQNNVREMSIGRIKVLNKHAQALLRYPPHFRSPGNSAYAPLVVQLIKDITNRHFIKRAWSTMSLDLKKHFWRQFPFVMADFLIKVPFFLAKRVMSRLVGYKNE